MIKNRSFMTGLGIGLLLGALLLQLMIVGQGKESGSNTAAPLKLSKEQLQQQADAMNLQVFGPEDKLMTEDEWKQQMVEQSAKPQGSGTNSPEAGSPAVSPEKPGQPTTPGAVDKQSPPGEPAAKNPKSPTSPPIQTIELQITKGSNLEDVAGKLKKAGVISDSGAFIQKGRSQKMSTKIQTGKYTFTPGEDLNSIINKITTKPPS